LNKDAKPLITVTAIIMAIVALMIAILCILHVMDSVWCVKQCRKQCSNVITIHIVTCTPEFCFLYCEGMKLMALLRVLMKFSAFSVCAIAYCNIMCAIC